MHTRPLKIVSLRLQTDGQRHESRRRLHQSGTSKVPFSLWMLRYNDAGIASAMSKVRETSWTYSAAACAGAAASRIARLTTISTMKFTASATMRRIDVLFEIERTVNGKTPEQRLAARREKSRRLVIELEIWMRQQRALLSSSNDTAKAINYLLNRWTAFTRFLDDGRVCLSNNAAE